MTDGNASVILLVEDEVIIAMPTKAQLEQYGYAVKNSSIAVLDASIKMAFKLFAAKRAITAGEQRRRLLHDNAGGINKAFVFENQVQLIQDHCGESVCRVVAVELINDHDLEHQGAGGV